MPEGDLKQSEWCKISFQSHKVTQLTQIFLTTGFRLKCFTCMVRSRDCRSTGHIKRLALQDSWLCLCPAGVVHITNRDISQSNAVPKRLRVWAGQRSQKHANECALDCLMCVYGSALESSAQTRSCSLALNTFAYSYSECVHDGIQCTVCPSTWTQNNCS